MSSYNSKYSGNRQPPKPRDIISEPGHELDPLVEIVIKNKSALADYRSFGDIVSTDTINFSDQGNHYSLPVFKFALMVENQCGIPHDHPNYPRVLKLDTRFKASKYFIEYVAPIKWLKDETYVHIPCHTRYVINRKGIVRNAFSGVEVPPNQWGTYNLVKDQATNKQRNVNLSELKILAFAPLPKGFIDFGFGTYSHVLDYSEGVIKWCERKPIIAKNLKDGNADQYPSAVYFANTVVSDFQARAKIARLTEYDLNKSMITAGEYSVKHVDFDPNQPVENFNVQPTPQPQQVNESQMQAVSQQTAPAAMQQPEPSGSDELFGDNFSF